MVFEENAVEGEGQALQRLFPLRILELALPNGDAVPAHSRQLLLLGPVPFSVSCNLLPPKISVGLRQFVVLASFVPVPKAAVDKDASTIFLQHQVGMSGQTRVVEPITEPTTPQPAAHNELGACVLIADSCHILVTLGGCVIIHITK